MDSATAEKVRRSIDANGNVKRLSDTGGYALGDILGEALTIGVAILVGLL